MNEYYALLEKALIEYVKRYGMSNSAREALLMPCSMLQFANDNGTSSDGVNAQS
jgi:hypothetical protein